MFLKKAFSTTNSSRGGEGRQGKEGSSNKAKSSAQEFDGYPNLGSATTQQPSNKRSLYTVPLYKEDYFDEDTPDSIPALSNGGGAVGQERVVSILQEQVAALVAKVGRLEKGLGRVPPSPAAANRGAAVQEDKSDVTGPSFQQLQKQITALERQQQELRAVSAHTPTHEQLVALQRQVDELRQQRPALQAKGETTGQGGSSDGTQTQQMLADLVQRLNAAEESLAQMRAMNSSKSPEGFVPRGEMMRAFSLLHDALAPKVKKILEEEGAGRQAGGNIVDKEIERQIKLVQQQGKREVEGLRREIEAFKISTSQAIAQAASQHESSRPSSSCESEAGRSAKGGACERSVFGELARSVGATHSPSNSKKATSPVMGDGASAHAEVRACKEMTAALEAELGLIRQLVDGMNNNFMRRVDTIDDQLLGLYERAGTLPGQVPPRSGPQSGVDCARREKQMADSIMENLMAEVGPGLETSLHDAEQALEIADETRADLEVVRGVVGKMGKKVEELSSGLVMVTSKLNNRLSKIEVAESERSSVAGTSRRGSDSGETTTSASSRSLLEKWRKTAGAPSSKDLRPSPYPSPSQVPPSPAGSAASMGRSGSGNLLNQALETPPRAKRASSAFRAESVHGELETVLSGEPAVYSTPVPSNRSLWDPRNAPADARPLSRESQQYAAQMFQRSQERRLEAQKSADLERVALQRERASSRLSSSGRGDSCSVASTDPDSPMPSAFKADNNMDPELLRQQLRRNTLSRNSNEVLPPRSASGRIRISDDGGSIASLPIKSGRIRFSEDGNSATPLPLKASQQKHPKATDEEADPQDLLSSELLRPSSTGGSVFARSNASSAGPSPVHSGKLAKPPSGRARGAPMAIHKEGPPSSKFKTTAQIEQERKDLLRKL
uniref:Uncharacterized protein n=2 Tax=Dunaliella tertiolecta TaxID=3047 RepID=A0A7S3VTX6_DUNTE|mmetsp:Transcript_11012/g.30194  ORF Transcript_11012/g.30194 Transcript_11012/m.30194 type:complete len:898 (+) Transcript_11012:102-2795(+)